MGSADNTLAESALIIYAVDSNSALNKEDRIETQFLSHVTQSYLFLDTSLNAELILVLVPFTFLTRSINLATRWVLRGSVNDVPSKYVLLTNGVANAFVEGVVNGVEVNCRITLS